MDVQEKVIEKKVYEENGKHDYASKATGNAGLTLGIIGTALGAGAWLFGNGGRSPFGSPGYGNMPENVNINTNGMGGSSSNSPTALQVMEKECADEVKLLTDMFGLKLDTANKFYAMRETDVNEKFSLWKSQVDADFGLYKSQIDADFRLYKGQRDAFDALNEKFITTFCFVQFVNLSKIKIFIGSVKMQLCHPISYMITLHIWHYMIEYGRNLASIAFVNSSDAI